MDYPAGIGFTVPLFGGTVAFPAGSSLDMAKIGILFSFPFSIQYTLHKICISRKKFYIQAGVDRVPGGTKSRQNRSLTVH
jgi:hypothetical protein